MDRKIANHDDWREARLELLKAEKELTRLRDEVTRKRQALPWQRVDVAYRFDTTDGQRTLADLFDGRSQLLVQHFMFVEGWKHGCPSCSFMADHIDGMNRHLAHHDVTLVAVSRATLGEIEGFRKRMGWKFNWVSSHGSSFNFDFRVSFTPADTACGTIDYNYGQWRHLGEEWPGISAFLKDDDGSVYHTYSTYGRGVEAMMGTYALLDLAPRGRNEEGPMSWVRHHDRYNLQSA